MGSFRLGRHFSMLSRSGMTSRVLWKKVSLRKSSFKILIARHKGLVEVIVRESCGILKL